eukprot:scaffold2211_cov102-Cylindrotheca_fusiformis.AAC.1
MKPAVLASQVIGFDVELSDQRERVERLRGGILVPLDMGKGSTDTGLAKKHDCFVNNIIIRGKSQVGKRKVVVPRLGHFRNQAKVIGDKSNFPVRDSFTEMTKMEEEHRHRHKTIAFSAIGGSLRAICRASAGDHAKTIGRSQGPAKGHAVSQCGTIADTNTLELGLLTRVVQGLHELIIRNADIQISK